jgi:hypothetical protein
MVDGHEAFLQVFSALRKRPLVAEIGSSQTHAIR